MIFKPELAQKILAGEKTQDRRIVKPGEYLYNPMPSVKMVISKNAAIKWITGQTYAIQPGRGVAAIGRFKLLDIRRERVQDISEPEAMAEAVVPFRTPTGGLLYKPAFASLWNEINGAGSFGNNPEVWVLTFELVNPPNNIGNLQQERKMR